MKSTAIVLAAGQGKRMNSKVQKQFLLIKGKPVLYYSLSCFQNSREIEEIIVVTGKDSINFCKQEIIEAYGFSKVKAVIAGGRERYDSVYAGLCACEDSDYVFIHDGARPFVTQEILERGLVCVKQWDACVAGMTSKDTVKIVNKEGVVCSTPDRNRVWNIQTPQVFSYALVAKAYAQALQGDCTLITDDAMVVEKHGEHPVKVYEGSYKNIKITTPEDLPVAELFLK